MATVHPSPPPGATPFAIYEDPEEHDPLSPSELYEGDLSFSSDLSGADVAIPTIEGHHDLQEEPEPYSGSYTSRRSSRRGSAVTTNSLISSLPSDISVASKPVPPANALESRYSPRKERPPFRNPSSVRAMQMASPPPLLAPETSRERARGSYKLATPSRTQRSESVSTTGTRRSRSHRDSLHRDYQAVSPRPSATPQPLPLVLLHVTILPMQMPYTPDIMVKIMPDWLVENYKVLEDKLQDIVLMRRGLLIQHPRDEYDLLEERILESLELKTPRLLKCGHFVAPDSDDDDTQESDEETARDHAGRDSRMSGGTVTGEVDPELRYPTPNSDDANVCMDCHRLVKKPGHGVGAGTKRWDIKIYAANGLMRAGAWAAAWSEMERCDVEISPWIPHEVRKTLEKRLEQEQEAAKAKALYAAELQRHIDDEALLQKKLEDDMAARKLAEEADLQRRVELEAAALKEKLEEEAAEKRELEATLNQKIEDAKEAIRLEFEAQALAEANCVAERFRAMEDALKTEREKAAAQSPPVQAPRESFRSRSRSRHRYRSRSRRPQIQEIPLSTLLKNYTVLQLQDARNFSILVLGALVVFLLTNINPSWQTLQQTTFDETPMLPSDKGVESVASVIITSTATMTATSYSTFILTETRTAEQAEETPLQTLDEAESIFTVPQQEESIPVTMLRNPQNQEYESESMTSERIIQEDVVELLINEDDNVGATSEPVSVESSLSSIESSEVPTSTLSPLAIEASPTLTEATKSQYTTLLQDNSNEAPSVEATNESSVPAETVNFPIAEEESGRTHSITEELTASLQPTTAIEEDPPSRESDPLLVTAEEPMVGTDELSIPLQSALLDADLVEIEMPETETYTVPSQKVVDPEVDEIPIVVDDTMILVHERDEL